jgi:hypothetical protein
LKSNYRVTDGVWRSSDERVPRRRLGRFVVTLYQEYIVAFPFMQVEEGTITASMQVGCHMAYGYQSRQTKDKEAEEMQERGTARGLRRPPSFS